VTPVFSTGDFLQRVDHALKGSPHLLGHNVSCEHRQGAIVLQGRVNSYYQKQMAQEALRNLEGIERIVNLLEVSWLEDRAMIKQDVESD
jgi:osmotically-inducible protein OsmY